ncbi:MAG: anion permease, partial [Acidaminococcaceae bacterium]|nr:anion permease [Acidaminococcaceae bacterium]
MHRNQWIKLMAGPVFFFVTILLLYRSFGFKGAVAAATAVWMAAWWILRPVNIAVTSLLPIVINALFGLIPNSQVISQYFSEICILLLGSDMICMTWSSTGLDKRLSVKALCCIGTSVKQQILVWLGASALLSVFLPNVVVAEIFCPIAVAMLKFTGESDIAKSKLAAPVLLAIGWGSGIGGFGSPIGSSANLVAISYLEKMTGHEFMYVEWITRFVPLLLLIFLLNLLFLWHLPVPVKELKGTKEYFREKYASFGSMGRGEKIGLTVFSLATALAFLRPLFADFLPGLKPAYCFLLLGLLMFVLYDENGNVMLRWEYAESHAMWGMYFLFASGIALGKLIIQTGAVNRVVEMLSAFSLDGGFVTVLLFAAFTTLMSEISSNTAAASVAIPVVASICSSLSLNPIPYVLITIVAQSCAYVLPVS